MSLLYKGRVALFFCLLLASFVHAAQTEALTDEQNQAPLLIRTNEGIFQPTGHLSFIADDSAQLTLQDILQPALQAKFKRIATPVPNFGFSNSGYWFRLKLVNQSSRVHGWILEIKYPPLDHVDLHAVYPSGEVRTQHGGDQVPFNRRAIDSRQINFRLDLPANEELTLYIRVQTQGSVQVPIYLSDVETFQARLRTENYLYGGLYGILGAMFILNLLVFFTTRDKPYLFYCCHVITFSLMMSTVQGLGYEFLWPNSPRWQNSALIVFIGCAMLAAVQFFRSFIDLGKWLPAWDFYHRLYLWSLAIITPFLLLFNYNFGIRVAALVALLTALIILFTGYAAWRRQVKKARYFMLAWSILLLGIAIEAIKAFGGLPVNLFTEYCIQVGSALEGILLSFALAERVRLLTEENLQIQNEAVQSKGHALQILHESNQALREEVERHKQTEASLFESREKYRILFETLPIGVIVTDTRGRIIEKNMMPPRSSDPVLQNIAHTPGQLQLVSRSCLALRKREWPVFQVLKHRRAIDNLEIGAIRTDPDGTIHPVRWYSVAAAPMESTRYGVILTYIDITDRVNIEHERRKRQADLSRASRINSMGEMASAMAHEINQPLCSALNYLHGMAQRLAVEKIDPAQIQSGVTQSIKQIERAGHIVQHIHNFTRHHTPQTRKIDLNELIRNILSFAEIDFSRFQTQLQTRLAKTALWVEINEIEIGQVIFNLIKNGIDAMQHLPPQARVLAIASEANGSTARVTVRDQGPGIPEHEQERIFETFFTTKSDGLGLGLSVCRTVIHSHHGEIWVASGAADEGACVKFSLPLSTQS